MSNLSNYGTVTTKDILARRLYNDETSTNNPVGIIINSSNQCLDIDAGTTIALTAANNMDIVAGAGLDFATTGATDLTSTTDITLESGYNAAGVVGNFTITSNGYTALVSGANMTTDVTGTFDTNVSDNITIDSSGGAISIGADAVTGAMNLGTGGSRTKIQVGNSNSTTAEIEANAVLADVNVGTGGFDLDATNGSIAIDASGAACNFSVASTAGSQDLTFAVTGATDSSVIINSSGTSAADAIILNASAGGMDIDVNQNRTLNVGGNSTDVITGVSTTNVTGTVNETYGAGRTTAITGAESLTVSTTRALNVTGASVETYTSNQTVTVNGTSGYVLDVAKKINVDSADTNADAIVIKSSGTGGGVDITANTGGFDVVSSAGTNLSGAGATSTITLASAADAQDLTVSVTGATDSSLVLASSGTSVANALELTASAGGMDINVNKNRTLDVGVNNTETIVGDDAKTVTGKQVITVNGTDGMLFDVAKKIELNSDLNAANAVVINASNTAGGIDIDAGTGGISQVTTGAYVESTTLTTGRTMTGAETITNSSSSIRTVTAQYSVTSNQAAANAIVIDAANAAGGIDMDCGTAGFNLLSTGGAVNVTGQNGATVQTTAATSNVVITAAGGGAQKVNISCAGTGADAIDINATAGGIDIDCAGAFDLSAGTTINIDSVAGGDILIARDVDSDIYMTKGANGGVGTKTVFVNNLNVAGTLVSTGSNTNNGDLVVNGDFTVHGTTTTLNTTTVTSDDKNIELNSITAPTNDNANGGGLTLKIAAAGTTEATFTWDKTGTTGGSASWSSSEDINVVTGKMYAINDKKALSSTQLYVNCASADANATVADNNGAIYLNQAVPGTDADGNWRVKVDNNGDVVFQKRVGGAYQNKFRIQ